MEDIDLKKTKYFVIAIIILILLGVILIVHFNNKELVSGNDKENVKETTTTTTTITTTTKKVKLNDTKKDEVKVEEVVEEKEDVIYKSTIDEEKLVYNYKLTDEISNNDTIVSTKLSIDEILKEKNVIGLYDISLFDEALNKKSVSNSLITIKIPIKDELVGYDEYRVVYINELYEITDEKIESRVIDNYIEFNTTHLSLYGIVGTNYEVVEEEKEEIVDLSKVNINISVNDEVLEDATNILLSREDKLDVVVNNINYKYEIYYALRSDKEFIDYKLLGENILDSFNNANKYTLLIKVVVNGESKEFEVGNISVYDIVFVYDNREEIKEDKEIGTIYNEDKTIYKNEDGSDYLYNDFEINQDIVIDSIEENKVSSEEIIDDTNKTDDTQNESILEEQVSIKVNGNIYLVEETDISKLEMTGHLIIDTSEDITFDTYEEKLLISNLYTITIRSKEFSLNGEKYTYEYVDNKLIIKLVKDDTEVSKENFEGLFENVELKETEENIVLEKKEILSDSEQDNNVDESNQNSNENVDNSNSVDENTANSTQDEPIDSANQNIESSDLENNKNITE